MKTKCLKEIASISSLLVGHPSAFGGFSQNQLFMDGCSSFSSNPNRLIEKQPLIFSAEIQNPRHKVGSSALSCCIWQSKAFSWSLLGQEPPQLTCGKILGWVGCPAHLQFSKPLIGSCERPSCSCALCVARWASKASKRATDRLWQGLNLYQKRGQRTTLKHIIVSPPKTDWHLIYSKAGYKKLKSKVLTQLKKAGCGGGSIVFHHSRHGKTVSPHFHIQGTGYIHNTKEIEKKSGYVISNVGKRLTKEEVLATFKYQLSHCSLSKEEGKQQRTTHVISYFGQFSYTKVVCSRIEKIIKEVVCGHCGGQIRKVCQEAQPTMEELEAGTQVFNIEISRTYSLPPPLQKSLIDLLSVA